MPKLNSGCAARVAEFTLERTMLDEALDLAETFGVFPLEVGGKQPNGRLAPHGARDNTQDTAKIRQWWGAVPDSGIGISMGHDLLAFDLDLNHGADSEILTHLPETRTHYSGRGNGNRHLIYRVPCDRYGQRNGWVTGVDVKAGEGAYLVAPPTPHPETGGVYTVGEENGGQLHELTDAEAKRIEEACGKSLPPFREARKKGTASQTPRGREVTEGTSERRPHDGLSWLLAHPPATNRNEWLTHVAGHYALWAWRALGEQGYEKYEHLCWEAAATTTPPLPEDERTKTAKTIAGIWERHKDYHEPDLPLADKPLADEVAEWMRPGYRFAVGLGWVEFNGQHWEQVPDKRVRYVVGERLEELFRTEVAKRGTSMAATKDLAALRSRTKIQNVLELASGHARILTDAGEFDQRPDLLNVRNGVVDLRTGDLLPPDPSYLMTKITDVDYVPGATHEDWDRALEAFADPETLDWMHVRFGQAITGHRSGEDQGVVFLRGEGSNGKSTILRGIRQVLGTHAGIVPKNAITAQRDAHPAELMTLMGVRFALAEELPSGVKLGVERIKDVTGPEMTARAMRQDWVTWPTTHSLFISTNPRPVVRETDWGSWRRLVMVEFPLEYTEDPRKENQRRKDPCLLERLERGKPQHEAILAWLVAGARRWYEPDGKFPPMPSAVKRSTQAWRTGTDVIGQFVEEFLTPSPGVNVSSTALYGHFTEWQKARGMFAWSDQEFSDRFASHYWAREHEISKSNNVVRQPVLSDSAHPEPHKSAGKIRVWRNLTYRTQGSEDEPLC